MERSLHFGSSHHLWQEQPSSLSRICPLVLRDVTFSPGAGRAFCWEHNRGKGLKISPASASTACSCYTCTCKHVAIICTHTVNFTSSLNMENLENWLPRPNTCGSYGPDSYDSFPHKKRGPVAHKISKIRLTVQGISTIQLYKCKPIVFKRAISSLYNWKLEIVWERWNTLPLCIQYYPLYFFQWLNLIMHITFTDCRQGRGTEG